MAIERQIQKNIKAEEEKKLKEAGLIDDDEKEGKKKKKKKGKKGKKVKVPPLVGPYVKKLHLSDNGIDYYEEGDNKINSLRIIHDTISMFVK